MTKLAAVLAFLCVFLLVIAPKMGGEKASALARALGRVPLRRMAPVGARGIIALVRSRSAGLLPGYAMEDIKMRLNWAGRPWGLDAEDFLAVKVISGAVLGVLLPLLLRPGFLLGLFVAGAGAVVGYILPDSWLRSKGTARRMLLRGQVSGFSDLLAVACEAGLDLLGAVEAVSGRSKGVLASEFSRTRAEIMAGKPREEAWRDLAERNGCDELTVLVNAISQAERYGTPVAEVLRAQSGALRELSRARLQELAQGLSVKMIVPVMIFDMIPLMVLLLAPFALNLMSLLGR